MLSLKSVSGSFGLGVRPMKMLAFKQNGKQTYGARTVPAWGRNERLVFTDGSVTVHNASGNSVGTATAATLISGTEAAFVEAASTFSATDNCWYFLAKSTSGLRLIKALPDGTISTPGALFAGSFYTESIFMYEAEGNLVLRNQNASAYASPVYVRTLSKTTGQIVTTTTDDVRPAYVSEDGRVGLSSIHFAAVDAPLNASNSLGQSLIQLRGLYYEPEPGAGVWLPKLTLSSLEFFGLFDHRQDQNYSVAGTPGLVDSLNQIAPVLFGDGVAWLDLVPHLKSKVWPRTTRAELDRWLRDIGKKFSYYSE